MPSVDAPPSEEEEESLSEEEEVEEVVDCEVDEVDDEEVDELPEADEPSSLLQPVKRLISARQQMTEAVIFFIFHAFPALHSRKAD